MRAIERRAYLRVNDRAFVEDRVVSDEQARRNTPDELLEVEPSFSLRSTLYRLEIEAREAQREIALKDRVLGSYFHNLNQRIELLSNMITRDEHTHPENVIDLSPAGVSYISSFLYPPDDLVAIKLAFTQDSLGIMCFGRIRYSLLAENDRYRIGVQFLPDDSSTEALIARRISALQAEERRKRLHRI